MAINANELRLGNWVYYYDGNKIQVNIDVIRALITVPAYCDPIPLTPELLIACGFSKKSEVDSESWVKDDVLRFRLEVSDYHANKFYYRKQTAIQYLHQLQNLYFALTQTELTINLKATTP